MKCGVELNNDCHQDFGQRSQQRLRYSQGELVSDTSAKMWTEEAKWCEMVEEMGHLVSFISGKQTKSGEIRDMLNLLTEVMRNQVRCESSWYTVHACMRIRYSRGRRRPGEGVQLSSTWLPRNGVR